MSPTNVRAMSSGGNGLSLESKFIQEEYEENILRRAADFRPVLEIFYEERLEELY
jgi:hypothetical protein